MASTGGWRRTLSAAFLTLVVFPAPATAQPRTDVVTLRNGDRITGEVMRLDRGRLEFKTDDAGTIYFEWDKIQSLEATRHFDVSTTDGRRFLGSLRGQPPQSLVVVQADGPVTIPTWQITAITPIGESFWSKLDGSVDIGFSYTRSSEIAQLNLNASTVYRRPAFEARADLSGTLTQSGDDEQRDDRGTITASYLRFRGRRWFVAGGMGFETNESLGLQLRSQLAVTAGPRLVNSNRAQVAVGAGLSVNQERRTDAGTSQNLEGILTFRSSYFTYDRPKTNVDVALQYFPSLSDWGRQRLQLDASFKRELWKDVFVALNLFDTYDSRPPSVEFKTNDIGIVFSFGLTY